MSKIELLSDRGRNAFIDFFETGMNFQLKEWIETAEADEYFDALYNALPNTLTLYRGLNGVLIEKNDPNIDLIGYFSDSDINNSKPFKAPNNGTIESWTDQRLSAERFAMGESLYKRGENFGTVLTKNFSKKKIIYHYKYVNLYHRFEDESEITIQH